MDKNQAIGFVLMAALLMVYFIWFAPKIPEQPPANTADTVQTSNNSTSIQEKPQVAEAMPAQETNKVAEQDTILKDYGVFTSAITGKDESRTLENDELHLSISTRGARILQVELKEYDDFQYKKPLILADEKSNELKYIVGTQYGNINLASLYYTSEKNMKGDTTVLTFTAKLDEGKYIKQVFSLAPESYTVYHRFIIEGLENDISGDKVSMIWDNHLKRLETDLKYSRNYTTVNYFGVSGSKESLSSRTKDKKEANFTEPVTWFSFNQKFFTTGYVFNKAVPTGYVSAETNEQDTLTVKYCRAMIDIPLANFSSDAGDNIIYYGPNKLKILKKVAPGFKENLYMGWPVVKWINQYVIISIFTFLEKYIGSYGLIIIILVFIIKLVLSPLTYKSHISMAKTKALKPEIDELKAKFGDDMQKMQSEQMKLYQKVGVNPLSGCIPMVLQMPILFAMFQFIPHAIEMRHRSFLWAPDLSTYDALISWTGDIPLISSVYGNHVSLFTLLMTVSTILYTWINSQSTAQMQGPMKSMQYFMPVIFMFVLNSYPAGLTFYYFVSNLVSFGQIAIIRRFVDDTKIRAILEENKKRNKNKKKSKFQARLEDAMKAQEESKKKKGK